VAETYQTIEVCLTSAQGNCVFQPNNTDLTYIVKVTPSEGTTCEESCSIEVILKPGESSEYTIALVPLKSTAVINVVEGGMPAPGARVDITVTGNPDVVDTCTTSVDGKCEFRPESNDLSYTATITPPNGTSCQDSCIVQMTLKPGENPEYTIVLVPIESTAIVSVVMGKKPVPGVKVNYFITGSLDKVIATGTTTTEGESSFSSENSEISYTAVVTPPEGTSCEKSCTVEMTIKQEESPVYTIVLVPTESTAIVNVIMDSKPVPGVQVSYFIKGTPDRIIGANTTSTEGTTSFSSEGIEMEYTATVTPPAGTTCHKSCTVEITLKTGEITEYTVTLVPIKSSVVINVLKDNNPVPGVQVDYFATGTPNQIIDSETTTTEGTTTFSSESTEMEYTATVTPPAGTTCQKSCTVEITLKTGEITEYTVILLPIKRTAIVNVIKDNKPIPGVQVDFFVTGTPNQIIESETTSTEGKTTFSTEVTETSFTAYVTPPSGMSCQDSCSVNMTLMPGKTPEYTVVLTELVATLVIKVEYEGESVPGAEVNFSMQNSPGKVLEACAISNLTKECELTIKNNYDTQYLSTVVPPAGFSCPEKGCSASFTLVPGKTLDYTFYLIKETVPSGEAIVSVIYSGKCLEGAQVEIFDSANPANILESFTTTSSSCNVTFTTSNVNVVYHASVTPPSGSYLCSGDFDSSCSATFKVVIVEVTIVQCILVIITQPPVTAKPTKLPVSPPTKKPTVPPTRKPTVAPTKKPTVPPTRKPTVAPTKKPTVSPTRKPKVAPTKKPTVPPTRKPTPKPTVDPTSKPSKSPTDAPVVTESAIPPSDKVGVHCSNDRGRGCGVKTP